jgi:hypothetical protein
MGAQQLLLQEHLPIDSLKNNSCVAIGEQLVLSGHSTALRPNASADEQLIRQEDVLFAGTGTGAAKRPSRPARNGIGKSYAAISRQLEEPVAWRNLKMIHAAYQRQQAQNVLSGQRRSQWRYRHQLSHQHELETLLQRKRMYQTGCLQV